MAATRKRNTSSAQGDGSRRAARAKCTVRRLELPTADVLRLEEDDGREVGGAFVRLAPRLRRSERGAFDASAALDRLRSRGARAAVFSPVPAPEEQAREQAPAGADPRAEVEAWFGLEPSEEAVDARTQCLALLDEVGL